MGEQADYLIDFGAECGVRGYRCACGTRLYSSWEVTCEGCLIDAQEDRAAEQKGGGDV